MKAEPKPMELDDVAQLKSGSERMVVASIEEENATCVWSEWTTKVIRREQFPLVCLMPTSTYKVREIAF